MDKETGLVIGCFSAIIAVVFIVFMVVKLLKETRDKNYGFWYFVTGVTGGALLAGSALLITFSVH